MGLSLTLITPLDSRWNFGVQRPRYPLKLLKVSAWWRRKWFYVPSVVHKSKSVRFSFGKFRPFAFVNHWVLLDRSHGCRWSRLSPEKILRTLPHTLVLCWGGDEGKTRSSEAHWRPCNFYWKRRLSSVIILPLAFTFSQFSHDLVATGELFTKLHP